MSGCRPWHERSQALLYHVQPPILALKTLEPVLAAFSGDGVQILTKTSHNPAHQNTLGAAIFVGAYIMLGKKFVKLLSFGCAVVVEQAIYAHIHVERGHCRAGSHDRFDIAQEEHPGSYITAFLLLLF